MVYIPFWICIFAGVAIDARERRFPKGLPAHVPWRRWRAFGSTSV